MTLKKHSVYYKRQYFFEVTPSVQAMRCHYFPYDVEFELKYRRIQMEIFDARFGFIDI